MMGLLGQLFGQQQPGILGQEIGVQPQTGPGFMAQADLQPMVGAQQQGPQGPSMEDIMGLARNPAFQHQMGMATGGQQQQPMQLQAIQQGAQTMQAPQIDPNAAYRQWIQSRNLPTMGVLGGMANGLR